MTTLYMRARSLFLVTPLGTPARRWVIRRRQLRAARDWERNGQPLPAPEPIKREILRSYLHRYGLHVLVETGTFWGDTVAALLPDCRQIYSIELSEDLHRRAQKRFAKNAQVHLLHGDSAERLAALLPQIIEPALFWLDAHFSHNETARGALDTPIAQELQMVLSAPERGHVILIDDARYFGVDPHYPTVDELRQMVQRSGRALSFAVETDIVRITPPTLPSTVANA
jgi:hypothetical protein